MPREKTKYGKSKLFYLDETSIKVLKFLAQQNGKSQSGFLDFLIQREYAETALHLKQKQIDAEISRETEKIEESYLRLEKLKNSQKNIELEKSSKEEEDIDFMNKKARFVQNIARNIIEGKSPTELKELALSQSIILKMKVAPEALLKEARTSLVLK